MKRWPWILLLTVVAISGLLCLREYSIGTKLTIYRANVSMAAIGKGNSKTLVGPLRSSGFGVLGFGAWNLLRTDRTDLLDIQFGRYNLSIQRPTVLGRVCSALEADNPHAASKLLRKNPQILTFTDSHGCTILHWVCIYGETEPARVLFELGAKDLVNRKTKYGYTPVHPAARSENPELLKLCLDNGGDPNIKDEKGRTALDIATANEDRESIELLLKYGAVLSASGKKL